MVKDDPVDVSDSLVVPEDIAEVPSYPVGEGAQLEKNGKDSD